MKNIDFISNMNLIQFSDFLNNVDSYSFDLDTYLFLNSEVSKEIVIHYFGVDIETANK